MEHKDMMLILVICDLLGKPVKPKQVEEAIARAQTKIENHGRPPRDAIVTRAGSRD